MNITIRTKILIHAPVGRVWDLISNFEQYKDWNPYLNVNLMQKLEPKGKIKVKTNFPEQMNMSFSARLLRIEPKKELAWRGHLFIPGLFTGEHFWHLENISGTHTRLTHGEHFNGIFVCTSKKIIQKTEKSFKLLNAKIKEHAEGK